MNAFVNDTKILRTRNSPYSSLLINYSSFSRNISHSQHNLILSSHSNPIVKLNIQSMSIYTHNSNVS